MRDTVQTIVQVINSENNEIKLVYNGVTGFHRSNSLTTASM